MTPEQVTAAGDELGRWVKGVPTSYAEECARYEREMTEARTDRKAVARATGGGGLFAEETE